MKKIRAMMLITAMSLPSVFALEFLWAQSDQSINDRDIHVTDFVDMQYPPLARTGRIQGTVVTRLKLDGEGRVVDASVISGNQAFISETLDNVKKWRFQPNAKRDAVVVYNYKILDGRCNSNTASLFVLEGSNTATILTCPPIVNVSSSH